MQHSIRYIRAAIGCNSGRTRSYYHRGENGILYIAQSESALSRLINGEPAKQFRPTIRAGLMRQIDNFRRNCRRIMRERNCDYAIAAAIYRHRLRTC